MSTARRTFHIDRFSSIDHLPKPAKPEDVLACLRKNPRVSTFELSERPDLVRALKEMRDMPTAFHPSEHLREEMEARGWSLDDLADRIAAHERDIARLALDFYFEIGPTEPGMVIGDHMTKALAAAFGVSVEFIENIEKMWLDAQVKAP